MQPETQSIIDEILSMAPEGEDMTPEAAADLDRLLADSINDYDAQCLTLAGVVERLDAGEELSKDLATTGLQAALEIVEAQRSVINMLLERLNALHTDNQRLAAALAPRVQSATAGNC